VEAKTGLGSRLRYIQQKLPLCVVSQAKCERGSLLPFLLYLPLEVVLEQCVHSMSWSCFAAAFGHLELPHLRDDFRTDKREALRENQTDPVVDVVVSEACSFLCMHLKLMLIVVD
jgi:hypothetical protein